MERNAFRFSHLPVREGGKECAEDCDQELLAT
jgi:hypothetical protein